MPQEKPEKENRMFARSTCRIPCEFSIAGKARSGFVIDISASGVFIQTNAVAEPGAEATITIRPSKAEPITITATIARKLQGHRSMTTVRAKGIGLSIHNAPEAFFALVANLQS
jgi:hypothetical protein